MKPVDRTLPVLLMTATVTPDPAMSTLVRRNPTERFDEYLKSAAFYFPLIPQTFSAVIFAENSGADLGAIEAIADRHDMRDRLTTLNVPPIDPEAGRSAGEAHIVRVAMGSVPALMTLDAHQQVWKVTGRYIVRNMKHLVATAPTTDLYINVRRRPHAWCDTYAYSFTRAGYGRYLEDATEAIRAGVGYTGEQTMSAHIETLIEAGEPITPRLRYEPRISGVRGRDGASYGSPTQRAKYMARVIARHVKPGVWL
ncbi:hypothetical protein [uncultured Jatrophihabitans sp.]|uniref:hypothetical protein n=1 Tax=uncultured Jatrophihabitans sp. TaxID=1610747 RepID=UPI0035CAA688